MRPDSSAQEYREAIEIYRRDKMLPEHRIRAERVCEAAVKVCTDPMYADLLPLLMDELERVAAKYPPRVRETQEPVVRGQKLRLVPKTSAGVALPTAAGPLDSQRLGARD
jgi:hypothetical protein